MPPFNLKPAHKAVIKYYKEIQNLSQLNFESEGAVSPPFAELLRYCAKQLNWTLAEKYTMRHEKEIIRIDGALVDNFKLVHGYWEAKDTNDDLRKEVKKKFEVGYPKNNILFQSPDQIIIWQNGKEVFDAEVQEPERLIAALNIFFEYQPPAIQQWGHAVEEFKFKVPELATALLSLIEQERQINKAFIKAFDGFAAVCRESINPNLSIQAIEEMLIQHVLTERLFRKVFNNPEFVERNAIAHEIEKVIQALTSRYFSRSEFLKPLDRFYTAIEIIAVTLDDFFQKQQFLNTIYENFFQGFSVKVADTHGIVYTPQSIVRFMANSIEYLIKREFNRSLSNEGVHLLDPFVGTGNFIIHMMNKIRRTKIPNKYTQEMHCNEVMLLPYYIAALNIEHAYYDLIGVYQPFDGICLVDTFELAEQKLPIFTQENTKRIVRQKTSPIFVIIGNPPYNAGQLNENDNNKNRKYPFVDKRISETYGKDSKATLTRKLNDPYVKAIRWASDRIGEEGIIAFVTNNSYAHDRSFDGMRKHLRQDFNLIYVLDLGGNVRKNPRLSGTIHNVFGIEIGVSINIFIRKKDKTPMRDAAIYYASVDEYWRKEQKYDFLDGKEFIENLEWEEIHPDENNR